MNINKLKNRFNNISDLKIRKINNTYIIFINSIVDLNKINEYIIKNILNNKDIKYLGANSVKINDNEIDKYLLSGYTIIYRRYIYAVETKGNLIRSIERPTVETDPYGPKDSFNESIENNIGLIKRRIKSNKLINDDFVIGSLSNTNISLLYIKDIADINLVNKIKDKLNNISIDMIISVGNIKSLLTSDKRSPLPTIMQSERPDVVVKSLSEGKIVLVMDNSPNVIIMPTFFIDYINPYVDDYIKPVNANYIKIIRYICLIITLIAPGLYISLINYNIESIPLDLLINFSKQRSIVPFPTFVEAFIMLIIGNILKESDYRFPTSYGSSVSIVGALILGNAAVDAGLISPIMIIVIAITFISSMVFTDEELVNSIRHFRLILLLLSSILGLYGLFMGILIFLIHITNINVLGISYTYPLAPLDKTYFFKTIFKKSINKDIKRSKLLVKENIYKD